MNLERAHYPDHVIAEAHNLLRAGYSIRAVERMLPERLPGERTPTHETIRAYELALAESSHEETSPREARIIEAADNLIAAGLEHGAQLGPEAAWKNLANLNMIQGTFRDKQIKRQQLNQPISSTQFIIVMHASESDAKQQDKTVDHAQNTPIGNAVSPSNLLLKSPVSEQT